jgi:ABC-2 type transport system ATP-binding protein
VDSSLTEGIRARGLVKRFGRVVALDSLDLDVERGEIVTVLGPNGAGKSTLLRILGTLVLPDAGSASLGGVDVVSDPVVVRRRIGLLVGDERAFYWRLTGYENLRFFAALHGMRRRQAAARANELLLALGLEDAAHRRVLGYSSGMRARLLLARALLTDPPLLLLDEPTRTLDPLAASRFRDAAARLARERGAGILYATHDLHEAAAIADRVVILSAGKMVHEERGPGMDAERLESSFLAAVRAHGEELEVRADEIVAMA